MPFGQLVIGSPGSGKTTYCYGVHQFMAALKRPNAHIVNLDFANSRLPYPCSVDVNSLISVHDVMLELGLGPNGAILYCIEYLEENIEWLLGKLDALGNEAYVVFDLPGQVELSTNHPSLGRIVKALEKRGGFRLVALHLLDSTHILDPSRYVSLLLLSLRAMLHLELPHINVLTKVDLLGQASGGELPFPLEFYTDPSPDQLEPYLSSHSTLVSRPRYSTLNARILEVIDDFSLVGFETLAVEDKDSMWRLVRLIDKVGGWIFVHAGEVDAMEKARGQGQSQSQTSRTPFGDDDDDDDDDEEESMPPELRAALEAAYRDESGGAGPSQKPPPPSAASALSLFTTLDSGAPPGWGSAQDVQERYVDPYREGAAAAEAAPSESEIEKEFQKQEEERIYSAWRKWRKEEAEKQKVGQRGSGSAPAGSTAGQGRIQERWTRSAGP